MSKRKYGGHRESSIMMTIFAWKNNKMKYDELRDHRDEH